MTEFNNTAQPVPPFEANKTAEVGKPANTVEAKGMVMPEFPDKVDSLLVNILSRRRRHGTTGDTNFRIWLFNYIKKALKQKPIIVEPGNIICTVGKAPSVGFSCHVDTCHGEAESNKSGVQKILYDPNFSHIYLDPAETAGCLGGDDGVGVFIMLKMIEARKEGVYIFHIGEECGGIGAKAMVSGKHSTLLENLEQMVAFDRPVRDDQNPEVITHQGGAECASDDYAKALCAELNKFNIYHKPYIPSSRGVYTDSKEYRGLVNECVNLGVFYSNQHSPKETVYYQGVLNLLKAAIKIDWTTLPVRRIPKLSYGSGRSYPTYGSAPYGFFSDEEYLGDGMVYFGGAQVDRPKAHFSDSSGKLHEAKPNLQSVPKPASSPMPAPVRSTGARIPEPTLEEELSSMAYSDIQVWLEECPEVAPNLVLRLFVENQGLKRQIEVFNNFFPA